ncbi:MAG: hypothetical protein Q9201_002614 [Fulgogasparrea decipioides]
MEVFWKIVILAAVGPPALAAVHPLSWADIHTCSIRYGIGILAEDCRAAAVDLPRGNQPVTYPSRDRDQAYILPWERTVGTCQLLVELAGPETVAEQPIQVAPDLIRGLAGFIIDQCPGGADERGNFLGAGVGGFVTFGLERINFVLGRLNILPNPLPIGILPWGNLGASYITITVQRAGLGSKKAGDTDVSVAERVLSFAHTRWVDEDNPVRKDRYWRFADVMEAAVAGMTPDREVIWWERLTDTAKKEMEYTCDNKREGPAVLDCLKLQYHGLGKGTFDLG